MSTFQTLPAAHPLGPNLPPEVAWPGLDPPNLLLPVSQGPSVLSPQIDLAVISPHRKRVADRRLDCLGAAGPCPGDPCFQTNPINRPSETMVGLLGAQSPPQQEGWSARWLEAPPSLPAAAGAPVTPPYSLGLGGQSPQPDSYSCAPRRRDISGKDS